MNIYFSTTSFLSIFQDKMRLSLTVQQKKMMAVVLVIFAALAAIYCCCCRFKKVEAKILDPFDDAKTKIGLMKNKVPLEDIESAKFFVKIWGDAIVLDKQYVLKKEDESLFDEEFFLEKVNEMINDVQTSLKEEEAKEQLDLTPHSDIKIFWSAFLKDQEGDFFVSIRGRSLQKVANGKIESHLENYNKMTGFYGSVIDDQTEFTPPFYDKSFRSKYYNLKEMKEDV